MEQRNLIYQDLQLSQIFLVVFTILYGLFTESASRFYITPLVIPFTLIVVNLHGQYHRNKSEIFINSLPVSRTEIVIARYLYVFLYTGSLLLFLLFIGLIFHYSEFMNGDYLNLNELIYHLLAIYLAILAYLPLYFRFGAGKANAFFSVLYLFPLMLDLIGVNIEITKYLNPFVFYLQIPGISMSDPLWLLGLKSLLTLIAILTISVSLSIWFYQKREF